MFFLLIKPIVFPALVAVVVVVVRFPMLAGSFTNRSARHSWGGGAFWTWGKGRGGALISQLAIRIPLLKFSKMPLALLIGTNNLHSVCPFTVSNVSVIDLWQLAPVGRSLSSGDPASSCFFGSSWVVWGQKMSRVLSNTSVKVFFGTKTWGTAPPPPSRGYKLLPCSRQAALIKIAM